MTVDWTGTSIGCLDFPFYATISVERESPSAVFRRGVVQRMLDDNAATTTVMPAEQRPLLQHDLACLAGESGGPIVSLPSGMIIGIQVGNRKWRNKAGEVVAEHGIGVHSDRLWEVMKQAGLSHGLK